MNRWIDRISVQFLSGIIYAVGFEWGTRRNIERKSEYADLADGQEAVNRRNAAERSFIRYY